jgi:SagB-type dehydrogenase family enzyme
MSLPGDRNPGRLPMADDEYPIVDVADGDGSDAADTLRDSTYVRFCDGLAVVAEADRVLVAGGLRRHMFTGRDACRVVTDLVPLLDGRRAAAEAAIASGMTMAAARKAILIFGNLGLVEYADRPFQDDPAGTSHASAYFSRAAQAGTYRNSQDSREALAATAVVVLAGAPVAEALRADLLGSGIGSVVIANAEDTAASNAAIAAAARSPHRLVVGVEEPQTRSVLSMAEAACREHGVPLLRAARVGTTVELGPLFFGGSTACYECFNRDHAEYFADRSGGPDLLDEPGSRPLDEALTAMVGEEALAVLGHIRMPYSYRSVTLVSLTDYSDERMTVLPWPDCPWCGALSSAENEADLAGIYEWEVAIPPSFLFPPGTKSALARPDLKELATKRPEFPGSPAHPLPGEREVCPSPSQDGRPEVTSPVPLGTVQLARILARVGGRRAPGHPSDLSRWAPNGGNLASVGLYAITAGSGFGETAERLTVYDDIDHRLIEVRAGRVSPSQVLAETGLTATEPAAVLVFVAHVARIARKYASFGYRLAHLDAGVAATQLMAVAQELGLTVTFAPAWSDGLAEFLELLPGQEYITALAVVEPREG